MIANAIASLEKPFSCINSAKKSYMRDASAPVEGFGALSRYNLAIVILMEKVDKAFCKAAKCFNSIPVVGPILALVTRGVDILVLGVIGLFFALSNTAAAVAVVASITIAFVVFGLGLTLYLVARGLVGLYRIGEATYLLCTAKKQPGSNPGLLEV